MTTIEYDRAIKKLESLRQTGMSVADYAAQLSLFDPELNGEQLALIRELERRPRRKATDGIQLTMIGDAPILGEL